MDNLINPKVSIIVLNWNGWQDTIECIESIFQIKYPNFDIILLDNHSSDDSILNIKNYCKGIIEVESNYFDYNSKNKPIEFLEYCNTDFKNQGDYNVKLIKKIRNLILIKNDKNYGFSEGNNIGIRFALNSLKSDYILLLNNDTVVDPNFINEMIQASLTSDAGITGPTIYFYNNPLKIQSAGANFSWNKGKGKILRANEIDIQKFNKINKVDYVSGCALMVKSSIFKKIGYLNTDYFAYWEEVDFCIRAQSIGYKIYNVPRSKVWHKVSASTKKTNGIYGYYLSRNRFIFMKNNSSLSNYKLFLIYFFLFDLWYSLVLFLFYFKSPNDFFCYLKGLKEGIKL